MDIFGKKIEVLKIWCLGRISSCMELIHPANYSDAQGPGAVHQGGGRLAARGDQVGPGA